MSRDICLIICTHNKISILRKTISLILEYRWLDFGLMVVDNASSDGTREYCQSLDISSNFGINFEFVMEPRLGLSRARNTAAERADSKWLVYLDDDCFPCESFLGAYKELVKLVPDVVVAGGPILVRWPESGRPSWLPREFEWVYGKIEHENCNGICKLGRSYGVNGGNFLVQRMMLHQAGGFQEHLGHIGMNSGGNEEHFLIDRLRKSYPEKAFWVSDAVVIHHFPLDRLTLNYACQRSKAAGLDRAKADWLAKKYLLFFLRTTYYLFRCCLQRDGVRRFHYIGYLSIFSRVWRNTSV